MFFARSVVDEVFVPSDLETMEMQEASCGRSTGVLAIRKGGKLPPPVRTEQYQLEYGTASLELPADGIELTGRRVVIVDDVLATGGTGAATVELVRKAGAEVAGIAVILELSFLHGRPRLPEVPIRSLLVV